jgi:hypothetical protein
VRPTPHPFDPARPWPRPDSLPGLAARVAAVRLAWAGDCDAAAARFEAMHDAEAAAYWADRAAMARFGR